MQTRKWTDQSGAEKYTTEVVLQRFRGELTLLDSAAPAAKAAVTVSPGGEERAPSFGRSSPVEQAPGADWRRGRRAAAGTSTTTFRSERRRSLELPA